MRNLRDQRVNRVRFQGFRRPPNMWAKAGAAKGQGQMAAAQPRSSKKEQAFEASVSSWSFAPSELDSETETTDGQRTQEAR